MNNIKYIIPRTRACVLISDAWEEMNRLSTKRIIKSFAICGFISTPVWTPDDGKASTRSLDE